MRGSAGPGDDEQRKWVSMDEWRETEGEKNGQRREEEKGRKEGTRRYPFGLLQVVRPQLGPRRGWMGGQVCVRVCVIHCDQVKWVLQLKLEG